MTLPNGRKQRGTKEPLDEGERGECKSWLETQHSKNKDHGIRSHHSMRNRLGKNWNSDRLYFLGLHNLFRQLTWNYEIKRCLLLGRKTMTNLDIILKSRDITLLTEVHIVKAVVFPVVIYRCESWTIKKSEHRRMDSLELWYWRRLLRVPWTARRSNQLILKEINPEYSLEGLMLKLQYFGHLMQRANWLKWHWF